MKRGIILFSLICLCACSKETASVLLRAGIAPSTKSYAGEKSADTFPMCWSEGDVISVNGCLSAPLGEAFDGRSEAEFRVDGESLTAPYQLLYPASAVLSSQLTFDGVLPPMYASGDALSEPFEFHQASFGIRFSISGDMPLNSITLEAPGGESLTGSFALSFSDGSLTPLSGNALFTKDFASPEDISQTKTYTFFFSPGTFSDGIVLRADSPYGQSRRWLFASGRELVRGKMYCLPELSFVRKPGIIYVGLEEMTETEVPFEL